MRMAFLGIFTIFCLWACQPNQHKIKSNSAIDSTLQTSATAILESKLSELNAQAGNCYGSPEWANKGSGWT